MTAFSDFIRNATGAERAEVYGRVLDAAAAAQEALVREAGLEPACPKAGDFKSPVSTSFTTHAQGRHTRSAQSGCSPTPRRNHKDV